VEYIKRLADELPNVTFWGFTRKVDVAKGLLSSGKTNIKVIFSLDKSTPGSILTQVEELGVKTSWLYDDSSAVIPSSVHVIFPNHANGHLDTSLPQLQSKECPAIRNPKIHCDSCKHCIDI
jgi:hypothetical protein